MRGKIVYWNKTLTEDQQARLALEAIALCWERVKYSPFADPYALLISRCPCDGSSGTAVDTYQRIMQNLRLGDEGLPEYMKHIMLKQLPSGEYAAWRGMSDEKLAEVGRQLWAVANSLANE